MALLLALVLALIPLAIAPGLFFYFDVTPKIVVLLFGTAAALVWWSAKDRTPGFYGTSREARWFPLIVCGMAASLVVSTLASTRPALSFGGSNWRHWGLLTQLTVLGFAYLVAASCAGRPDRLRTILRGVAVSGLVTSAYGIAQYFGWDPLLDPRGYHVGEGIWTIVRPPSTLGHADYFANWLIFVVFASAALALDEDMPVWRRLAWISVVLGSIAMILSGTRAPMIGLVTGALILAFWRGVRPNRRLATVALVIAAACAAFYWSPAGRLMRARVHWALREPAGGARLLLWRDSLRIGAAHWPAGYGPETFIANFALHQSVDLSRAYPDFYHESPHNVFLDVLVAQGVPGLLLLLAFGAAGLAAAFRSRQNPMAGPLAAGLMAMTISKQFACFTMPTAFAYYVTIAMMISLSAREALPLSKLRRPWLRLAVAIPCAAVLVFFGVRLAGAETALAAVRRDLDAGSVGEAAARFADYQKWRWPGASADLWYSRRLAQIAGSNTQRATRVQAFQNAVVAARRALETDEGPFNAYYNLASAYAVQNDFARTEQSLRSGISYAPNWYKTHWMLAQVLQAASRLKEAEVEASTAASLDGGQHPEVTSTRERIRAALQNAPVEPAHK